MGVSKTRQIIDIKDYFTTDKMKKAYAFVLGEYLGDGCIKTMKREVYRLDIYNDSKYEALNRLIAMKIQEVFPHNKVNRPLSSENCWDIYVYSKNIPTLFPQIGPGAKYKRKIELLQWQLDIIDEYPKDFISGLFYSDGSIYDHCQIINGKEYKYVHYSFSNKSLDIVQYLLRSLKQIGVEKDLYLHPRGHYIVQNFKKEQCKILAEFLPKRFDIPMLDISLCPYSPTGSRPTT